MYVINKANKLTVLKKSVCKRLRRLNNIYPTSEKVRFFSILTRIKKADLYNQLGL